MRDGDQGLRVWACLRSVFGWVRWTVGVDFAHEVELGETQHVSKAGGDTHGSRKKPGG